MAENPSASENGEEPIFGSLRSLFPRTGGTRENHSIEGSSLERAG
jgi:hypothetical protein